MQDGHDSPPNGRCYGKYHFENCMRSVSFFRTVYDVRRTSIYTYTVIMYPTVLVIWFTLYGCLCPVRWFPYTVRKVCSRTSYIQCIHTSKFVLSTDVDTFIFQVYTF
jgi:hypothetical protein